MLPYAEFVEQIAYYKLFPWGDDWLQTGVASAAAANSHPYRKNPARPEQYMPKIHRPAQTPKQQTNILMAFIKQAEAQGAVTYSDGTKHQ